MLNMCVYEDLCVVSLYVYIYILYTYVCVHL